MPFHFQQRPPSSINSITLQLLPHSFSFFTTPALSSKIVHPPIRNSTTLSNINKYNFYLILLFYLLFKESILFFPIVCAFLND